MSRFACLLIAAILAAPLAVFVGCGSGAQPVSTGETPAPSTKDQIATQLDLLATTGVIDSGIDVLGANIDTYVAENPAAAGLQQDFQNLKSLQDPGAVKAKAKAMRGQL
ncbi:MAG TPA: hypothetical protein VGN57_06980 [Pirellulaceae bacterium]|jgi:hypothetical protein|nr:hypothetical protein [Pirellulaceae bacterium]